MLHAWTKVRLARLQPRLAILRHHLLTQLLTAGDDAGGRRNSVDLSR
jgi:hypothetical protein